MLPQRAVTNLANHLVSLACLLLVARAEHVWVAQINGGHQVANSVAAAHGLRNDGPIPHLKNKFVLRLPDPSGSGGKLPHRGGGVRRRVQRSLPRFPGQHAEIGAHLARHPEVSWISFQHERRRTKRDLIDFDEVPGRQVPSDWRYSGQPAPPPSRRFAPEAVASDAGTFVDPFWPRQWYLHDTRDSSEQQRRDLGVLGVWGRNMTGRGVVVAVVDDGLESDHPDLRANFDPDASYDYIRGVRDPKPVYYNFDEERKNGRSGSWHGTRCAGEIAMTANNSFCGVGVAFNARVGGIKILGGPGGVTDLTEARGLTHALERVHVYSNSWGPDDDGATFEKPRRLTREALRAGAELGRGGLGAVYVWAAGNGGAAGDNCNCDGYAASVFTLTVGSVSQSLRSPWYAEPCPAALAVAFSSGSSGEQQMVTTDLRHQCAVDFSGTSAAAPVAAGIVALALEANPGLTWRDVQHAVAWTANPAPLQRHNVGAEWRENAAGHLYHHRFGFGLFNAGALMDLVQPPRWQRVPEKTIATIGSWTCRSGWELSSQSESVRCELQVDSASADGIGYLEHVQLRISLSYTERGALAIYLTSGAGSKSQLLTRRRRDLSDAGLRDWDFMTVHFWGESPLGKWQLEIEDQSGRRSNRGLVQRLSLRLHGTAEMPHHRARFRGRRRNSGNG